MIGLTTRHAVCRIISRLCLLPDKGNLSIIRRSFMPLESPESLLMRCDLMANPTPASCRSSFLRPLQKKVCSQHQLLLKALLLQGESHSELQSRLCIGQVLYQPELFFSCFTIMGKHGQFWTDSVTTIMGKHGNLDQIKYQIKYSFTIVAKRRRSWSGSVTPQQWTNMDHPDQILQSSSQ